VRFWRGGPCVSSFLQSRPGIASTMALEPVEFDGSVKDDILAEWIEDSYQLELAGLSRSAAPTPLPLRRPAVTAMLAAVRPRCDAATEIVSARAVSFRVGPKFGHIRVFDVALPLRGTPVISWLTLVSLSLARRVPANRTIRMC
jgi:hypothetical protein